MRIDDSTMLMLRVVEQREPLAEAEDQPRETADGTNECEDDASLGWIRTASQDLKSVSAQMAQQADQASEFVLRGLRSLKERALQKYRDAFNKDKKPPQR